jgi:hypothetical protein
MAIRTPHPRPQATIPVVRHLSLEYMGFRNGRDRREYVLCARLGTDSCNTPSGCQRGFHGGARSLPGRTGHLLPKLRRELADTEPPGGRSFEVTKSELLSTASLTRRRSAAPRRRSL